MRVIIMNFLILIFFINCGEQTPREGNDENFSEADYRKVQGIIVKEDVSFNYEDKFKKDIYYVYQLDLNKPLTGVEKQSKKMFNPGDPVAVMVHLKDSSKSFIAHRGIINEDLLVEYLTRTDNDYLSRIDEN